MNLDRHIFEISGILLQLTQTMASSSSSPDMEDAFELTQVDTQAATQVEEELSQEVVDPDTSTEVVDNDENSMDLESTQVELEGTQIDAEAPTQVEDFENIGNEIPTQIMEDEMGSTQNIDPDALTQTNLDESVASDMGENLIDTEAPTQIEEMSTQDIFDNSPPT